LTRVLAVRPSTARGGTIRVHAPHLDVPPPFWMVAVPALDLAAATSALATAITLLLAVLRRAPGTQEAFRR